MASNRCWQQITGCSYLRKLAKWRSVRWRLVIPKEFACSIAVVTGSCWPVDKAKRVESVVKMVGDGMCARDIQAERSSDCTSSRVRLSKDGNSFTVRKLKIPFIYYI